MKLVCFLVLISCLHVSAASHSQVISFSEENTTLKKVFKAIEAQTGYVVFYNKDLLLDNKKLAVHATAMPLDVFLDKCLSNQPLTYRLSGKNIILTEKRNTIANNAPLLPNKDIAILTPITGRLVDSLGTPLRGATIAVKGKKTSVVTNAEGRFVIEADTKDILVISFVGYETQELRLQNATLPLNIVLKVQTTNLDDVIVTAYSTFKKETFTGTATTITKREIQKIATPNILSIIQSLDASFVLTENIALGSNPNAVPESSIRGSNSITGTSSNPLVILNGFEISMRELYDIDIERIEVINILKDATATALYGSRGANGVIQVETSLPKDGKLSVSYSLSPTLNFVDLSSYNLLNAIEKLEYERQAGLFTYKKTGDAAWDPWYQAELDNLYFTKYKDAAEGVNTYWLSQPIQSVLQTSHNITIGGGAKNVRYQISGNYADRKGTMKGASRQTYGASFRLEYRLANKFTFANEGSYSGAKGINSPYGSFSTYTEMNPYWKVFDADGNYITRYEGDVYNPLYIASLKSLSQNASHIIRNNTSLDWFINNEWRINGSLSLQKDFGGSDNFKSPFHPDYSTVSELEKRGSYTLGKSEAFRYEGRLMARYNKILDQHIFAAQVTGEFKSQFSTNRSLSVTGFSTDDFIDPSLAIRYAEGTVPSTSETNIKSIGAVAAFDYSYDLRYAAQFSLRLDGSSLFGAKERYQYFPSYGIRWNIDNESFFSSIKNTVNRFAIRASYGMSSSQDFSSYQAISTYNYAGKYYYNTAVANLKAFGNENLKWQQSKQLNIGFDLEALDRRIGVSFNVYDKMNDGMVISIDAAPSLGFNTYYTNVGSVRNRGFDVTLTTMLLNTRDFSIKSITTADKNTSKLLNLTPEYIATLNLSAISATTVPLPQYVVGESIDGILGVRSVGIDPANGKEMYLTKDNKLTYIWDAADKVVLGNKTPKIRGNQSFDIFFKDFSLYIASRYSIGGDIYNSTLVTRVEGVNPKLNVDKGVLNERWKNPGDISFFRDIKEFSIPPISSRFVQTENHFSISSISLRYNDKGKWLKKYNIVHVSYQIAVNELLRISNVERERGTSYPFEKSISGSIRITF